MYFVANERNGQEITDPRINLAIETFFAKTVNIRRADFTFLYK